MNEDSYEHQKGFFSVVFLWVIVSLAECSMGLITNHEDVGSIPSTYNLDIFKCIKSATKFTYSWTR